MTPAKILTNKFLVRCGELWPDTVRLEETGVGDAVPIMFVSQAVALLHTGNIKASLPLLQKRVKYGIKGQCDLTGFLMRDIGGERVPHSLAVEIKATKGERLSEDQVVHHEYLKSFNVIVLVVRDLDQGIADLQRYAGRGERK